ncbi:FGGY family carhohydrate kinase [Dialister micraerophilus DSM 19965]|uniref:FGGY family carhohydrate kinase n=1 Tax=Dialister micraerophilus DSM 19965 TaxID=888062 RepID=F2BVW1_9FIRM|nr:FGGY family carhohydrate kinase [Dialister micraerophilus DSM 19965]
MSALAPFVPTKLTEIFNKVADLCRLFYFKNIEIEKLLYRKSHKGVFLQFDAFFIHNL